MTTGLNRQHHDRSGKSPKDECPHSLASGESYITGEMAHVIAHSPTGPRGRQSGGTDTYDNLILLCPFHHTEIDKAPDHVYPESLIRSWKRDHEERIQLATSGKRCATFNDLKHAINRILIENKSIFDTFGPKSDTAQSDPGSNLHALWTLKRLDTIIPNNRRIINFLEANHELTPSNAIKEIQDFKTHAIAYERHVYEPLDGYPQFPKQFSIIMEQHD